MIIPMLEGNLNASVLTVQKSAAINEFIQSKAHIGRCSQSHAALLADHTGW